MNNLKICFKVEKRFLNNKIFKPYSGDVNMWDSNLPSLIKINLEKKNFLIGTQDIVKEKDSDIVIYNYYPKRLKKDNKIKILLAMESIAVVRRLDKLEYFKKFDLVFSCNDKYVDNETIFKINFSFDVNNINTSFNKKTEFLCNFSSNKFSFHKNELYTERIIAINFFESVLRDKFHLYGQGWNKSFKYPYPYLLFRYLNKSIYTRAISKILRFLISLLPNFFQKLFFTQHESYRGYVLNKFETLSKYKFSICYENILNNNSYITEKIFDSLRMGVIPVYYGASNISSFIPEEIFINRAKFKNYKDLYQHLINIDESKYSLMIDKIKKFLKSDQIELFTDQYNVNLITNQIQLYIDRNDDI